jgi:hypothetical protein
MSRSKRYVRSIDEPRDYKKNKRKMPAYVGSGKGGKFLPERDTAGKITRTAKLIAKNANRSLKKAARQKAKKDINEDQ